MSWLHFLTIVAQVLIATGTLLVVSSVVIEVARMYKESK